MSSQFDDKTYYYWIVEYNSRGKMINPDLDDFPDGRESWSYYKSQPKYGSQGRYLVIYRRLRSSRASKKAIEGSKI